MPAETHSHSEPVTAHDILDLLSTIVHDDATSDPETPLAQLGLSDELSIMAFWDVAVEEYGERSVGEPDLDDLASATTAVDLAERTVRNLRVTDTTEAS